MIWIKYLCSRYPTGDVLAEDEAPNHAVPGRQHCYLQGQPALSPAPSVRKLCSVGAVQRRGRPWSAGSRPAAQALRAGRAAGLKVLHSDVRIDLLVTDVGLPGGMNGRQMADAARNARPN